MNRARKLRTAPSQTVVKGDDYTKRLQAQFRSTSQITDWATLPSEQRKRNRGSDSSEEDSEDDEIQEVLKSTESMRGASATLPATQIRVNRMKDANVRDPSQAVV